MWRTFIKENIITNEKKEKYKGYQLDPESSKTPNGWITKINIWKVDDIGAKVNHFPCDGIFKTEQDADNYAKSIGAQVIDGEHPDPDFKIDF